MTIKTNADLAALAKFVGSQVELERISGIDAHYISRLINGKHKITNRTGLTFSRVAREVGFRGDTE